MPSALQYGMSVDEFWYGDIELLNCYKKAYLRNSSYNAWLQGNYVFEAISKAIYNGFGRTKKTDEPLQYGKWNDPIEVLSMQHSNETTEERFRRQQREQNAWLRFGSQ